MDTFDVRVGYAASALVPDAMSMPASEPFPAGLRIALIGPAPPPSGGMANQTRQLARLLKSAGVAVEVVQVNRPYRPNWIARARGVRAAFRMAPYLVELWQVAGRVDLFHVMANSGWSWHLFAAPAVWIGSARGVSVVVNYRGGEAEAFLESSFRSIAPTLRRAKRLIVPSGFLRDVFGRWRVDSTIVPNIIDLERFERGHNRRRHSGPTVLVARNLEPIYDIPTAIRAFKSFRELFGNSQLVVAGSGPERKSLEVLCDELGLSDSVRFTGRVDNEHMPELYRDADIVLNPSLADNMPNSVLEALSAGKPVVSTDVGGIPYLVKDRDTALLVPSGDHEAMAAAMAELIEHPALAQRLITNGLTLVSQYDWSSVRSKLAAVYAEAIGN